MKRQFSVLVSWTVTSKKKNFTSKNFTSKNLFGMRSFLFLFFALFASCSAQLGGVSTVPVTDEYFLSSYFSFFSILFFLIDLLRGVIAAGSFSFSHLYHSESPASYKITSATQQVPLFFLLFFSKKLYFL